MSVDGNVRSMMEDARSDWVPRGLLGPTSDTLRLMCADMGWKFFLADVADADDKKALMTTLASRLSLPDYFGYNWDALADCLADLGEGSDGVVFRLKGSAKLPAALADTLFDVLADRVFDDGRPFIVVSDPPLPSQAKRQ